MSDEEAQAVDRAQTVGATVTNSDGSITTGASVHEEVMMPFPGLQETPQHAV